MFNVPLGVIRCAVKNDQLSSNWSENYYLFNALNLSLFVYVALTDRKIKYFFLNYHKLLKVTFPLSETTKIHKTPPCGHLPYCKADAELCYPLCPSGSGLRCPTAPLKKTKRKEKITWICTQTYHRSTKYLNQVLTQNSHSALLCSHHQRRAT